MKENTKRKNRKNSVMESSPDPATGTTNLDVVNSPGSVMSETIRNRKSFEGPPGSFTPSSSVYSASVSQTSSALGRLIEYVEFPHINLYLLAQFNKFVIEKAISSRLSQCI